MLFLIHKLLLKFINQQAEAENICISLTRLVAPNYARKDFSLNLVLPVPEFSFSRPIPLGNFLSRRLGDCDDSGQFRCTPVTFRSTRKRSPWKPAPEGDRHFVPDSGVSENATNLYLPHPGLKGDHYQSFLLNCGSPGV